MTAQGDALFFAAFLTGSRPSGAKEQDSATLLLIRMVGKLPSRGPSHIARRTAREPSDCGTHESDMVHTAVEGVDHGACTSRPSSVSAGIGLLRLPHLDGAWHELPSACFFRLHRPS